MEKMLLFFNEKFILIPLEDIFKKDSLKLAKACKLILMDWLHPYKGCYISRTRPRFAKADAVKREKGLTCPTYIIYRQLFDEWCKMNPEERQKEVLSRQKWEEDRNKAFKTVYGIAKRHHLWLEWCGNATVCREGDHWLVYKDGKRIGMLEAVP